MKEFCLLNPAEMNLWIFLVILIHLITLEPNGINWILPYVTQLLVQLQEKYQAEITVNEKSS